MGHEVVRLTEGCTQIDFRSEGGVGVVDQMQREIIANKFLTRKL
jgi:hypothetical protein